MANVEMQYILWGQKEVYNNWLEGVKADFQALESIQNLEAEVAKLREAKRTLEGWKGVDCYRYFKWLLQQRWMNYFEDKLVEKLKGAMREVNPGCLTVIVLPEAIICDYITNDEKNKNELKNRGYGYINPLYEETVRNFLEPFVSGDGVMERMISEEDGNQTLLQFTDEHPQVLLFAGTVWWKQWKEGYPKGVIFNSAPVFYRGKCCFMWDKQYISDVDGLKGNKLIEQWIKYRINEIRTMIPAKRRGQCPADIEGIDAELDRFYGHDTWNRKGILSSLTIDYNHAGTPLLEFVWQGESILFGVDICRDNVSLVMDKKNGKIILDIDDFLKKHGLNFYQQSLAEYFGKKAASVNVIAEDGSYSISGGKEREIGISIIVANDLGNIHSHPKYHVCKADANGYGHAVSRLITGCEERLRPLNNNFFLASDVVWTEPRVEQENEETQP